MYYSTFDLKGGPKPILLFAYQLHVEVWHKCEMRVLCKIKVDLAPLLKNEVAPVSYYWH